ncbi:MAG: glycosyltransferase [bacterium]|nr:glycosyltransferase [bacterium]
MLCSDREGLSNAILEYMASGLPVVATAVTAAILRLVDAENELLVPPGDEKALAGAIGALIADAGARRRMGEASRRRIADQYAWDRSIGAHGAVRPVVAVLTAA